MLLTKISQTLKKIKIERHFQKSHSGRAGNPGRSGSLLGSRQKHRSAGELYLLAVDFAEPEGREGGLASHAHSATKRASTTPSLQRAAHKRGGRMFGLSSYFNSCPWATWEKLHTPPLLANRNSFADSLSSICLEILDLLLHSSPACSKHAALFANPQGHLAPTLIYL